MTKICININSVLTALRGAVTDELLLHYPVSNPLKFECRISTRALRKSTELSINYARRLVIDGMLAVKGTQNLELTKFKLERKDNEYYLVTFTIEPLILLQRCRCCGEWLPKECFSVARHICDACIDIAENAE